MRAGIAKSLSSKSLFPIGWAVVLAVLVALPWLGAGGATTRLVMLVAILALTVSGLNLTLGYAGELSLGQAAVYAAGAYATGYLATAVVNDLLLCLVAAIVAAVVVGVVTGLPGLRLGGWTLAIASFFVVLLIPPIVNIFGDGLGGYEGLTGIPIPRLAGVRLGDEAFYVTVVLVAAAWFALFRNIVVSRHGSALLVLKQSPVLASALGTSPHATKVKAYALGAVPAGIAGCFVAYLDSYLSPLSFGLELSIVILAASILGGSMSVYGAVIGAAIMQIGPLRVTVFDRYALIAYGIFLVLGGLLLRNGLAGFAGRFRPSPRPAPVAEPDGPSEVALPRVEGRTLTVSGATKRFGGNVAVEDVSFEARPGRITALVGPNGSGKTTLMNLVSGYYRLDAGEIALGDGVISGLPAHRIARHGVGRTFQTPLVPDGLSVRDAIIAGRLGSHPVSITETALRLPRHRRAVADERRAAHQIMETLGLTRWADSRASDLALGTRRMLELGRAIAGGGSLVLLDEVASGLDEDDIAGLVRVLGAMRDAGVTVLLVEHNFSLVRAVADHVVVLAEGRVLAAGDPAFVAAHPDVVRTYLGEGGEITGTRLSGDEPENAGSR